MKSEAALLTLPEIKRMLRLRSLLLLGSILFTALTVTFSFGQQAMHWQWPAAFLIAAGCGIAAFAGSAGLLMLNKKLASIGL